MSDQNEWPKPGEQQPDGTAPASTPQPDPFAQSGQGDAAQGASSGDTAGQPNPYGQNPYGQNPYGQAPSNPYGAPASTPQNPYGAPGSSAQPDPYGAPGSSAQPDPYGIPGQQSSNPYAAPGQSQGNPYAAPRQPQGNPYGPSATQQPYGQQYGAASGPYASAGYQPYAQRPKTNLLAILSICFGLGAVPLFFMAILLGPAGAILGHIALGKIRQSGEQGRGLALTGIIAGWVMTGIWILWIVFLVVLGINADQSYTDDGTYDYGYDSGAFVL